MRHGVRQLPGHAEGRRHRVLRGRNDPARALIRHSHAELVEASKKMSRHHDRTANKSPSQRQLLVGEMLRHALSDVLRRGELRDADLEGVSVTITQVKTSPDMRYATIFCEPLGGKSAMTVVAGLNRHKALMRGEMGRLIALKFMPALRFPEDESFAEAEKIQPSLMSTRVARNLSTPKAADK